MGGTDSRRTTQGLAEFITSIRSGDIPEQTLETAGRCVLDLLGAAAAGFDTPAARAARNFGLTFFPKGSASVWFSGYGRGPSGAAMINAVAASALDLDDGNRAAGGHPGAAIIPACLAFAECLGKQSLEFLTAVVLGYEVAVRVSTARDLAGLDTFSTGRWCGYGAAAAAGWLAGSDAVEIAQAMSIAGIHAPIQSASAYSRMGHATKEGIPWATLTGLAALELSRQGYTGPLDILDHRAYFDGEKILKGLGQDWTIDQTYFKPYSCCRWIHAALDGLAALMTEHRISAAELESMEVQTFGRAVGLENKVNPGTLEGAQFSVPYCLALAAVKGLEALQPISEDSLGLADAVKLAQKIRLVFDQQREDRFPDRAGARLILATPKGKFSRLTEHPRGDPANPMAHKDLENKFRSLCAHRFCPERTEALLFALDRMQNGELTPLLNALNFSPDCSAEGF